MRILHHHPFLHPTLFDRRWCCANAHPVFASPRPRRHVPSALFSIPGIPSAGAYVQDLAGRFSPEEINKFRDSATTVLGELAENLTALFQNQQIDFVEDELRKFVVALSAQLSDFIGKLSKEDVEYVLHKFLSENGSLEEIWRQTEAVAARLQNISLDRVENLKEYLTSIGSGPSNVQSNLDDALTYLYGIVSYSTDWLLRFQDHSGDILIGDGSSPFLQSSTIVASISSIVVLIMVNIAITSQGSSQMNDSELPARYDPDVIEAYFRNKPMNVYSRLLQVAFEFSSFAGNLVVDKLTGNEKENEKVRARELVDLITKLGPTSIKIGQALSIRPDILPVTYIEELQKLQDRVPPFSSIEAKSLIADGLGMPIEEAFSDFSAEPVAAASLGQVYKARLKESGETVAVKVQRPGVLEGICRDLYLLRISAKLAQSIPNVRSNLVALLDNWALRFFDELDYEREGENALRFSKYMESLPNIIVPNVYMQYTSRKVLTTQWVAGEKLSESKSGDLLQLVKVALNCYLMQLLESGFLHADPHPGNLLRTDDGCLCVLDYGLMTEITQDQRYAFIDYISHLVNADYALVAEDLVKLGFVPPELVDPEKTAAVVPQLSRVLGELLQGGGARKVNFQQITEDLSTISRDYVFVIPPYFALILRAFSVLEGIGLAADPDYAILDDCYPYLCKRLVTDDSPRTRAALKYFVYGGKERIDVARAENIISGFKAFQTLTVSQSAKTRQQSLVDPAAKEVLTLVFSPNGSYLQELLLTELVRIVDALSRDAVAEVWRYFASRALITLPPALMAPKSWPIPLPGLLFGSSRVAKLTEEDKQSLEAIKRLWVLLEPQFIQRPSREEMREVASDVIPLISELFPGMLNTSQRFVLMLLQRQALRLADDLDGQHSVAEWDRDPSAFARKIRPFMAGSNPSVYQ